LQSSWLYGHNIVLTNLEFNGLFCWSSTFLSIPLCPFDLYGFSKTRIWPPNVLSPLTKIIERFFFFFFSFHFQKKKIVLTFQHSNSVPSSGINMLDMINRPRVREMHINDQPIPNFLCVDI
jgi:hypothetical protein